MMNVQPCIISGNVNAISATMWEEREKEKLQMAKLEFSPSIYTCVAVQLYSRLFMLPLHY